MQEVYETKFKSFNVLGHRRVDSTDNASKKVPEIKVDFISEHNWQLKALNSRILNPELYQSTEDVKKTIKIIKKWLEENPLV